VLKGTRGDAAETAAALIALLEEADRGRGTGTARKETHEA
jgi:hypothetical protein